MFSQRRACCPNSSCAPNKTNWHAQTCWNPLTLKRYFMNYVICFSSKSKNNRLTTYERCCSCSSLNLWACYSFFWHTASMCIASERRPNLYQLMKHICDCLLEAAAAVCTNRPQPNVLETHSLKRGCVFTYFCKQRLLVKRDVTQICWLWGNGIVHALGI